MTMNEININDSKAQNIDQTLRQSSSTVKNLQHWNYEWEKAYVEQENVNKQQTSTTDSAELDQTNYTGKQDTKQQMVAKDYTAEQLTEDVRKYVIDGTTVTKNSNGIPAAGSSTQDTGRRSILLPQHSAFPQTPGVAYAMDIKLSGSERPGIAGKLASPQWQLMPQTQPPKV